MVYWYQDISSTVERTSDPGSQAIGTTVAPISSPVNASDLFLSRAGLSPPSLSPSNHRFPSSDEPAKNIMWSCQQCYSNLDMNQQSFTASMTSIVDTSCFRSTIIAKYYINQNQLIHVKLIISSKSRTRTTLESPKLMSHTMGTSQQDSSTVLYLSKWQMREECTWFDGAVCGTTLQQ